MSLLLKAPASYALVHGTYDSATHDRFASGFPGTGATETSESSFLLKAPEYGIASYDLSGIGWRVTTDTRDTPTLISPRHFVTARHVGFGAGDTVRFLGSDGLTRDYTVAALAPAVNGSSEPTDLLIGTLTEDVDTSHISFFPIADFANESDYFDEPILLQGLGGRWGSGTIVNGPGNSDPFLSFTVGGGIPINSTDGYQFKVDTDDSSRDQDDVYFQVGDSSGPTFIVVDGRLVLVGIHTAVDTTTNLKRSYDTFVPSYLDQIDQFIIGDGYIASRVGSSSPAALVLASDSADPAPGGTPLSYTFLVGNQDAEADLASLALAIDLPPSATFDGWSGVGWSASEDSGTVNASYSPPLASGATTEFQVTITPADENPAPISVGATVSSATMPNANSTTETTDLFTPFSVYAAGLPDTTPSGDADDDGLANLTEYIQGLDAGSYSDEPDIAPANDGTLSFNRRLRTPVSAGWFVSTDLDTWTRLEGEEDTIDIDYNFEAVTFTPDAPFVAGDRRFLRLQVTE